MFDAYKVAVQLSLVNNVSTALVGITAQLHKLNGGFAQAQGGAKALERQLLLISRNTLIGGAAAGMGYGMLKMFKGPLDEAKKFQAEATKFSSLGFGAKVDSDAVAFARGMKTIGTSATENMALVSDAMAVFKDFHHAQIAAPLMAKMKFANQAVFGAGKGGSNEAKFMDMLKVIEFRGGLSSDSEFSTQANFVQKVITGSRNRVDATQLLTALKTGGVALSRRSNEQFYLGGEPLIQEFGGSRYGTGAMSIYQNLVQARGTITAQQELYRLGLLNKDMVQFNNQGRLKKALPGAFSGSQILEEQGELALLEKVLLPAFAAKGISGDENIIREIGMILGNRTGSSLMSRIYQQRSQIHTQVDANANAMGIDALEGAAKKTPAGAEIDLHAKWRNTLLELGNAVLPAAIRAVKGLTEALVPMIQWMREHQTATKVLAGSFAALGAAMAIGGTLLLLKAGFSGISLLLGGAGAAGGSGLIGAIAGLANPVGIAVLALGTLAAAAYAFRPMTQGEVDQHRGVHLSPEAMARSREMGWTPPVITSGFGSKLSAYGNKDVTLSDLKRGSMAPPVASSSQQQPVILHMDGKKVGEGVMVHMNKSVMRQPTGPRMVDLNMGLPAVSSPLGNY